MTIAGSFVVIAAGVSTHMPLARHDTRAGGEANHPLRFYSHASCEA